MNLLIIRHGPAGEREQWEAQGKDDRLRPLTPAGSREMREVSEGLKRLTPSLPMVVTSPLVRAAETAAIVGSSYACRIMELEELSPDSTPNEVVGRLRDQPHEILAVVGHEPHLSSMTGYLLTGSPSSFLKLDKGGACLVAFRGAPEGGHGVLHWLMTSHDLRRLGKVQ